MTPLTNTSIPRYTRKRSLRLSGSINTSVIPHRDIHPIAARRMNTSSILTMLDCSKIKMTSCGVRMCLVKTCTVKRVSPGWVSLRPIVENARFVLPHGAHSVGVTVIVAWIVAAILRGPDPPRLKNSYRRMCGFGGISQHLRGFYGRLRIPSLWMRKNAKSPMRTVFVSNMMIGKYAIL